MSPTKLTLGDQVRTMDPIKYDGGFVDCSTVLTVCEVIPYVHPKRTSKAYWTTLDGHRIVVALVGEVDKVI